MEKFTVKVPAGEIEFYKIFDQTGYGEMFGVDEDREDFINRTSVSVHKRTRKWSDFLKEFLEEANPKSANEFALCMYFFGVLVGKYGKT